MGLIMIVAGIVGGWKAGKPFDLFGLAALALFSAALVGIGLLVLSSRLSLAVADLPVILLEWLVLFLWGAVPFVATGFLKRQRINNREAE